MTKLNKFQNISFTLLRDLYIKDGLTPTREMITTALNNYLPRMEEVLKVTQYYKNQPRVIKFLETNKSLMKDVEIEERKLKEELKKNAEKDDEDWFDLLGTNEIDSRSVGDMIKFKSTKELEECLCTVLSDFYDGKINAEVDSFNKVGGYGRESIKLEVVLSKLY